VSNEHLYRDTATPEPQLAPASEGDLLVNEIAALHGAIAGLRQITSTALFNLSSRVINLEERGKLDQAERADRQQHLDRLLWAGLALAAVHLAFDAVRLLRGRHA
jgi:hypothetical protein